MRSRAHLLLAVLALGALAVPASAGAGSHPPKMLPGIPVPSGFVGVDAGGPLFSTDVNLPGQLDTMVRSGVQSIRVVFNWAQAQPFKSDADVPADQRGNYVDIDGVPTSFATTDTIVAAAAARGLKVLPTVLYAPSWDSGKNADGGARPPADPAPYGAYLSALIGRYGAHGSFWQSHQPKLAIRSWQIWNEPNISAYWPQPFAGSYVKLLRAAHDAVKAADPGAKVVIGAITNRAWKFIGQIYAIAGARRLFDQVSVNAFTSTPDRVVTFLQLVRRALNRLGDPRKPILMTELGWPSARGKPVIQKDWDSTERGQARKIKTLLPLLAAHRKNLHLLGFYYYTWITQEQNPGRDDFNFAGLLRYAPGGQITSKPALGAFRTGALALERCLRKGSLANRCAKRF